jgi:hypothetical protein
LANHVLIVPAADVLDVPDSIDTIVEGIEDAGRIVGFWTDSSFSVHGFLATPIPPKNKYTRREAHCHLRSIDTEPRPRAGVAVSGSVSWRVLRHLEPLLCSGTRQLCDRCAYSSVVCNIAHQLPSSSIQAPTRRGAAADRAVLDVFLARSAADIDLQLDRFAAVRALQWQAVVHEAYRCISGAFGACPMQRTSIDPALSRRSMAPARRESSDIASASLRK